MANDTTVIIRARDETAAGFRSAAAGAAQLQHSLGGLASAAASLPLLGPALAAGFAGVNLGVLIKDSIHFAAALDDMAAKTGASVENLSALAGVAKIGGHDLNLVEGAMIKLARAMEATGAEGDKVNRALKSVGLSQSALKGKDTAEAMQIVAKALDQYADGAGKTAAATELLGKSGAQALPFMQDLAEQGTLVATVTAEQAAQAEQLEKDWAKLGKRFTDAGQRIANDLLPMLLAGTEAIANFGKPPAYQGQLGFEWLDDVVDRGALKLNEMSVAFDGMRVSMFKALGADKLAGQAQQDLDRSLAAIANIGQRKLEEAKAKFIAADQAGAPKAPPTVKPQVKLGGKETKEKALKQSGPVGGLDDADSIMAVLKANEEIEKARLSSAAAMSALSAQFGEQNRAAAEALLIMPEAERRLAEQVKAVGDAAQKTRDEMTRAYAAGNLPLDEFMAKLVELRGIEETQVGAVRALALEQDKLNASWEVGARKALTAYLENARNTAKQFEGAFTTSFALIEDGLTRFVTTGKADMSQFATAIIQQFARIAVAKTVSGFAGMMFGGMSSQSGTTPGQWNFVGPTQPQALGGVFTSPSLSAYSGQVYSTPQAFTFAKGAGIFGEAGPEAIMPLSRDSQGRLGVKAEGGTGGGPINITMNIDATGGKTQGDAGAAGDLGRKLEGAVRGVLLAEMRPGGLLAA